MLFCMMHEPVTVSVEKHLSFIENKARESGRELKEVLQSAKVNLSTWYRWKANTSTPTLSILNRIHDELNGESKSKEPECAK